MKKNWFWFALVLAAIMLDCNIPFTHNPKPTSIYGIKVTPPSGQKNYSLEVSYHYEWDRDYGNAEICCTYTAPGGSIIPVGSVVPEGMDRDREDFSRIQALAFSVKVVYGNPEQGIYTAACETEEAGSRVTTAFVVTGEATATPGNLSPAATEPPVAPP